MCHWSHKFLDTYLNFSFSQVQNLPMRGASSTKGTGVKTEAPERSDSGRGGMAMTSSGRISCPPSQHLWSKFVHLTLQLFEKFHQYHFMSIVFVPCFFIVLNQSQLLHPKWCNQSNLTYIHKYSLLMRKKDNDREVKVMREGSLQTLMEKWH